MAWFRNSPSNDSTTRRVCIDDSEIATISNVELPVEKQPTVQLDASRGTLAFAEPNEKEHVFDLTAALQGYSWAHFSIRIHENSAVQADWLLSLSAETPDAQYSRGEAPGLRFQPFFLSQSDVSPAKTLGGGLFRRGLHFSGTVTPNNVSVLCLCDECGRSSHLQSFHAGFSNLVYFYCDLGIHTLTAPGLLDKSTSDLQAIDSEPLARFESTLPNCNRRGGRFRYYNPLRCPHCQAPYIDFQRHPKEREYEYYGNCLYGDEAQPTSALGT